MRSDFWVIIDTGGMICNPPPEPELRYKVCRVTSPRMLTHLLAYYGGNLLAGRWDSAHLARLEQIHLEQIAQVMES